MERTKENGKIIAVMEKELVGIDFKMDMTY